MYIGLDVHKRTISYSVKDLSGRLIGPFKLQFSSCAPGGTVLLGGQGSAGGLCLRRTTHSSDFPVLSYRLSTTTLPPLTTTLTFNQFQ